MKLEQSEALRKPFPAGTVGKLPRNLKKQDRDYGKCAQGYKNRDGQPVSADGVFCGGYHARSIHLDYVGHAAVTDRLLSVDPEWTWEPLATTPEGLPLPDSEGNLWIRLTVCGHTRIGVGDGPSAKERVGDALRNGAMRFGVALDLWSKEELESGHAEVKPEPAEESARDVVLRHHQGDYGAAAEAAKQAGFDDLRNPDVLAAYAAHLQRGQA